MTDKDQQPGEYQHMGTTGIMKPEVPDKSYDISLRKKSPYFIAHLFRLEDSSTGFPQTSTAEPTPALFTLGCYHISLAKVWSFGREVSTSAGIMKNGWSGYSIKTRSALPMSGYVWARSGRILNHAVISWQPDTELAEIHHKIRIDPKHLKMRSRVTHRLYFAISHNTEWTKNSWSYSEATLGFNTLLSGVHLVPAAFHLFASSSTLCDRINLYIGLPCDSCLSV